MAALRCGGDRIVRPSIQGRAKPFRLRLRVFAYVSDFVGLGGPEISRQKRLLKLRLRSMGMAEPVYVIDSGWRGPAGTCPPAVFSLIRSARERAVDVLAVEAVTRLAGDDETAHRIAAILCDAGVQLLDARRQDAGCRQARKSSCTIARGRVARVQGACRD